MPPSATSNRPRRSRSAPVNAPRTWPNSSLSSSGSGTALQLIATNGAGLARAVIVERARDELLAGAALADDHDRQRGRGGAIDDVEHAHHRRRAADDALVAVAQAIAVGEVGLDAHELGVALGELGGEPAR